MGVLIVVLTGLLALALLAIFVLKDKINKISLDHVSKLYEINTAHLNEQQKFQERSRIVNKGLISQEMVPLMPNFPYAFKDARRAVHPLDYIVFDGLSDGDLKEIIFLEVKTGTTNSLTPNERQIQKAVNRGSVRYEIFNPDKNPDKNLEKGLDKGGS